MSMQTRPQQPSRRNVLRAAAWTAPAVSIAVAAPAFAAVSSNACTVTGTRNGANFYATVGCNTSVTSITSVQIGSTLATFTDNTWYARLSGLGQISSTQLVTVTTPQGSTQKTVTFVG